MIVIIALVFVLVVAIVSGFSGSYEIDLGIEINRLNSPYYKIGIFSDNFVLEDGSSEHQLIIGLFFINLVAVFWKPADNSDII